MFSYDQKFNNKYFGFDFEILIEPYLKNFLDHIYLSF